VADQSRLKSAVKSAAAKQYAEAARDSVADGHPVDHGHLHHDEMPMPIASETMRGSAAGGQLGDQRMADVSA